MAQIHYFSDHRLPLVREIIASGVEKREKIIELCREPIADDLESILFDLKSLQMIDEVKGKLIALQKDVVTEGECPSPVLLEYHRKMIQKSAESLDQVERTLREIQAMTIAIDPKELPDFKDTVRKFLHDLATRYDRKESDQKLIYQLNLQGFPLTR
jgi:uncharacterized protein (TIGR02147 family)